MSKLEQVRAAVLDGASPAVALTAHGLEPSAEVVVALTRARAEAEVSQLHLITLAARAGSWGAAAWLLERAERERRLELEQPTGDGLDELAGRRSSRRAGLA